MKKRNIFLGMLTMVGMFFATSCSQDELFNESTNGDFVNATFTIGTADGIGTRAVGDGTTVDKVACAVYDADGDELKDLYKVEDVVGKTATYNVRLAKGQNYRIAFFAYNAAAGAYDVTDLKNIVVKDGQLSNVEGRDAFTAYVDVTEGETMNAFTKEVTLKRPFAQLNLGIDDAELAEAANAGLIVAKSKIVVSNVYNAFSAFDNAVAENAVEGSMTFELNTIPTEKLKVTVNGEEKLYNYLALNYLLVGDNGTEKTLTDVEFIWKGKDGETNDPTTTFLNIPVQRNYRTNIVGKLLTSPTIFNIIIDEEFEGEKNDVRIFNAFDLQAALNAAPANATTVITLGADIVGNVTDVQIAGGNVIIDGCGYKYNGTIKVHSNSNYYTDAALTIKNLDFETSTASINCIEALENGSERYSCNITVENCTFTATGDAVNTSVGVQVKATRGVTVKNCIATNMHSLIQAQSCDTGDVKVIDCTVNGKNGVAFKQVKSATVEGTTITAAAYGIRFDGNIDNYGIVVKNNNVTAAQPFIVRKMIGQNNTIALEGNTLTTEAEYHVVITNGSDDEAYVKPTGTYTLTGADNYNIFPEPFPVASWDEFTAALAAGETDIKLTADIEYASNYQLQKSVTLNLGGYSMTLPMINIHTKTTIKNGTINGKVYARNNSEIVFNKVTFSGAVADNLSTEGHLAIQGGCKSLYAKDCLFSPTSVSGSQTKPLSFEGGSTIMKFENCEFKSSPYKKQVYFNSLSAAGSLDFTNCNFNNKTPNIMFAAACPLTNLTMSGTTKLSSVTLETNRAQDAVTAEDLAYLRESLIANNSMSSVRLFYAGGSSEYIR